MYDTQYAARQGSAEQQTQLLIQGRYSHPPTSVAHMADRLEASGAKIEEALSRLNCRYTTLFFISGWIVIFSGLAASLGALAHLSLPSLTQALFILLFGIIVMVLDVPGAPAWAEKHRKFVRTYFRFMTRITGKSLFLFYLGSMIAISLWPAKASRSSGFWMFISLFLSLFVLASAIAGICIGLQKSFRLEAIRKQVNSTYKGNIHDAYSKFAITNPVHGMQTAEFNRMCADVSQGRCQFDTAELALIFNCLDSHSKATINENEFSEWVTGSMVYI